MENNSISIYVDSLPKGSVIMWYGEDTNVPKGWCICDGGNGSPDLRGKFPIGINNMSIKDNDKWYSFSKGDHKEGFNTHITEQNIPTHSHTATVSENGNHKHKIGMRGATVNVTQGYVYGGNDSGKSTEDYVEEAGSHTHIVTIGNTGKGEQFNVIPPYLALYFIYKYQ